MTSTHIILGAGPVGQAIARHLLDTRGVIPTVVTRSGTSVEGAVSRVADLADANATTDALAGADVVYQCSQPNYDRWPEEFPALQDNIVEAASATGAVLVATENMYGYGPVDAPLQECLPLAATTKKGAVRAQLWRHLQAAHESGKLRAVAARASDFYGPGVVNSAFGSRLFDPLVSGKKIEIIGDPSTRHTITYVPDLARAMVLLGESQRAWGRAWHIPNAPAETSERVVEIAARCAGTKPAINSIGPIKMKLAGLFVPAAREMVELSYEFDRDFVVDDAAYTSQFGADFTPLEEGLEATVSWYQGCSG